MTTKNVPVRTDTTPIRTPEQFGVRSTISGSIGSDGYRDSTHVDVTWTDNDEFCAARIPLAVAAILAPQLSAVLPQTTLGELYVSAERSIGAHGGTVSDVVQSLSAGQS